MTLSFDQIIKSTEQLPAAKQERIRRWLNDKGARSGGGHGSQAGANSSTKSLQWLRDNREKYPGQWVVLDGDRLIASGPTAKEVYSRAKAEGVEIPVVELVNIASQCRLPGLTLVSESITFDKTHYYNTLKPEISLTQFFAPTRVSGV